MEDHPHRSRGRQHRRLSARRGPPARRATLYGHVAVVESGVDAKAGTVTIGEMNGRGGLGIVSHRTHRIVGAVYILPNGSVSTNGSHRHGFRVIRFRFVRFVVIVRLVVLLFRIGGGMDVSSSASGSTDVVVDYDGDGTHATPEQARAIAEEDDRLVQGLGRWRL